MFFLPQLPGLQIFSWNVMSQCRYNGGIKTNRAQAAQRTTSFSVPLMQACRLAVLSTSDPISARPAPTSQMDRAPPSDDGFNKNEGSDEYERRILQAALPATLLRPGPALMVAPASDSCNEARRCAGRGANSGALLALPAHKPESLRADPAAGSHVEPGAAGLSHSTQYPVRHGIPRGAVTTPHHSLFWFRLTCA